MGQPGMTDLQEAFGRRGGPGRALAEDAGKVAAACHDMAIRFHRGGKLIVFGNAGAATDAQHIAVEFVHPVIVGKRALPAIALTNEPATLTAIARADGFDEVFAAQVRLLADPADIALGVSADGRCVNVFRGLAAARKRGLLTIAMTGAGGGDFAGSGVADHLLTARSGDPCVVKEIHVTTYHILWELVHVFFDQPGLLTPEVAR
jgi:D-sedoheptulose 7-phosphate isomerase